jgi:hypothetical protein
MLSNNFTQTKTKFGDGHRIIFEKQVGGDVVDIALVVYDDEPRKAHISFAINGSYNYSSQCKTRVSITRQLLSMYAHVETYAKHNNLQELKCKAYVMDRKQEYRERAFQKLGFVKEKHGLSKQIKVTLASRLPKPNLRFGAVAASVTLAITLGGWGISLIPNLSEAQSCEVNPEQYECLYPEY